MLVCIDFGKGFDTARDRLFQKIKMGGIHSVLVDSIQNWLTYRRWWWNGVILAVSQWEHFWSMPVIIVHIVI